MNRPPIVAGLLFVALGTLLLLDQLGTVQDAGEILGRWWPLALVLVGLGQAVLPPRNPVSGVTIGVIGGALLLRSLDVVDGLGFVWPVLLIGLGLWLISGRATRHPGGVVVSGSDVSVVTVFGDRDLELQPGPFTGGDVTTIFGDVELDLRRSHLEHEATVQATTIFGDLDLVVPEDLVVRVTGPQVFGDVRIADPIDPAPDAPPLVLRLLTVFGDVEVKRARAPISADGR